MAALLEVVVFFALLEVVVLDQTPHSYGSEADRVVVVVDRVLLRVLLVVVLAEVLDEVQAPQCSASWATAAPARAIAMSEYFMVMEMVLTRKSDWGE